MTAVNITPQFPTWYLNDSCRSVIPPSPSGISPLDKSITKAVALHINIVSTNTPKACTSPCFTGWSISAAAAAQGADPDPASLENNPLFTPCITTVPNVPPKNCFIPKACSKISLSVVGIKVIFFTIMKITTIR